MSDNEIDDGGTADTTTRECIRSGSRALLLLLSGALCDRS